MRQNRKDLIQETSTFQESLISQGNEVGELARQLYPEGVLIDEDHQNIDKAVVRTQMEIQNGAKAIFEGAFLFKNVVVRVDILVKNSDYSFDLIEVKGSSKFKEKEHLPDCTIQAYVLQQSGIRLRNICIAYLALRDRMPDQPPLQPSSFCDGTSFLFSSLTYSKSGSISTKSSLNSSSSS